jgi:hypothetical protein
MFFCGTSRNRLSTSNQHPRASRNPRGLPRIQRSRSLWTRTPRMRHLCSPCSRAMVQTRPRPWTPSPPPHAEDWRAKYFAWMDRGELPPDRSEARRIARMAKSFIIVDDELYKRAASGVLHRCIPTPARARAPPRHPRGRVWPPRGTAYAHGQCVPPGLLLAHRGR